MEGTMAGERAGPRREVRRAGALAGVAGALAMMAFMVAAGALEGDALDPIRAVGTAFRGEDASGQGTLSLLWGIAVHVLVGVGFGVVFAALAPHDLTWAQGAVLGGGCAILLMALVFGGLGGMVAPLLRPRMSPYGGGFVVACALFGAVAGLGPKLSWRLGERTGRRGRGERAGVLRTRTAP